MSDVRVKYFPRTVAAAEREEKFASPACDFFYLWASARRTEKEKNCDDAVTADDSLLLEEDVNLRAVAAASLRSERYAQSGIHPNDMLKRESM